MHCPFCGANDTKVIDSRLVAEGEQVRRRRECVACGERFTTFETAELVMPRLIKSDGSRQPFDEDKLRAGMQRALEKSGFVRCGRIYTEDGSPRWAYYHKAATQKASPAGEAVRAADG